MTCIAAVLTKSGGAIVASDSMVAKDSGEKFPSRKLRRVRGGVAAAAGDDEAVQLFLEWQAAGGNVKERPYMKRAWQWEGMLVTRSKIIDFGGQQPFPDEVERPFHAIGVGADGALAVLAYQVAMVHPLDPAAAIRAVCTVHRDCGPPINVIRLKP